MKYCRKQLHQILLIAALVALSGCGPSRDQTAQAQAQRAHMEEAWKRFNHYCKNVAGDKLPPEPIKGVEGIFIMKPREYFRNQENYSDQFWMGDPYGYTSSEASSPGGFLLYDKFISNHVGEVIKQVFTGYEFIETPNPEAGNRSDADRFLRWTLGRAKPQPDDEPVSKPTNQLLSRFGYTWDDLSNPEDRKYWIAGGRLRIVDLRTNETVGERIGYVIDPGQGNTSGGRSPWLFANDTACPKFEISEGSKVHGFISKVIASSRESLK